MEKICVLGMGHIGLSTASMFSINGYKVVKHIKKILKGISAPKIAALGVSYKGNVDDTRESPACGNRTPLRQVHRDHLRSAREALQV